jgi:hypothetical protein
MALPGLFCQSCGNGQLHWDCPGCGVRQKLLDILQYDAEQSVLQPWRKSLFKKLFGSG